MEMVSSGHHLTPPEGCPDLIKTLMLSCWTHSPNDRTTFANISEQFKEQNLKTPMGHTNSCYGVVKERDCGEAAKSPKSSDQQYLCIRETDNEQTLSWPKLSNFSKINIDPSNCILQEESSDTSTQSLEQSTKYTTVLWNIAEDEEAEDEYLQPLRGEMGRNKE